MTLLRFRLELASDAPPSQVDRGALGFGLIFPCPKRALWAHRLPLWGSRARCTSHTPQPRGCRAGHTPPSAVVHLLRVVKAMRPAMWLFVLGGAAPGGGGREGGTTCRVPSGSRFPWSATSSPPPSSGGGCSLGKKELRSEKETEGAGGELGKMREGDSTVGSPAGMLGRGAVVLRGGGGREGGTTCRVLSGSRFPWSATSSPPPSLGGGCFPWKERSTERKAPSDRRLSCRGKEDSNLGRTAALPLGHYMGYGGGPPCCLGPHLPLTKNPNCVYLSDCLLAGSRTDWLTVNLSSRCTAEGNRISHGTCTTLLLLMVFSPRA